VCAGDWNTNGSSISMCSRSPSTTPPPSTSPTEHYCSNRVGCSECTVDPACGWCSQHNACMRGDSMGPCTGNCTVWEHGCVSFDRGVCGCVWFVVGEFPPAALLLCVDVVFVCIYVCRFCAAVPCAAHRSCGVCTTDPFCGECGGSSVLVSMCNMTGAS